MSDDLKVTVRVDAFLDPSYQKALDRAEMAVEAYGQEVDAITRAHAGTGDPLSDAETGYAAGERAAGGYREEVDKVSDSHDRLQDEMDETERLAAEARSEAKRRKDEAAGDLRDMAIMGASVLYGVGRLAGEAIQTDEQGLSPRSRGNLVECPCRRVGRVIGASQTAVPVDGVPARAGPRTASRVASRPGGIIPP